MEKFQICNDENGNFRFKLKGGNGQTILTSKSYEEKAECIKEVEFVRIISQNCNMYESNESEIGKSYFNLRSSCGRVIGTSKMYTSKKGMEYGITSVKRKAPRAIITE